MEFIKCVGGGGQGDSIVLGCRCLFTLLAPRKFVQKQFFEVFCSTFRLEGSILSQKDEMEASVCFRNKLVNFPLKSLGNWEFSYFIKFLE